MSDEEAKLTPQQDELLTILIEECAEVIQAATKMQRFGILGVYDTGETNIRRLMVEIGDVFGVVSLLMDTHLVDPVSISIASREKIIKVVNNMKYPPEASREPL